MGACGDWVYELELDVQQLHGFRVHFDCFFFCCSCLLLCILGMPMYAKCAWCAAHAAAIFPGERGPVAAMPTRQ